MAYDFIADVGVDGGVIKLKGETTRAFGVAPEHFLHSEFINHVAESERHFLSDLLFDVQQGQDRLQETVTLLNGNGGESRFLLEIGPVFRNGAYAFTRIGAKKLDPFDGGLGAGSAFSMGMSALEDTLFEKIDRGEAGRLSLFTVADDAPDAASQGGALHDLLSEGWAEPGQVARLNDRTTALIHDDTVHPSDIAADLSTRLGPDAQIETFSIDLGDEAVDKATRQATVQGFLAAASMVDLDLGDGVYTITRAAAIADQALDTAALPPAPPIAVASRIDDPNVEIGVVVAPELTHRWNRSVEREAEAESAEGADILTPRVVDALLQSIEDSKPEDMPVVVPIDAGALLSLGVADWDRYDLLVMPVNLRKLAPAHQSKLTTMLESQYVMMDIVDLVASATVSAELVSAGALAFLRADIHPLLNSSEEVRSGFLTAIRDCSDRGIYLWLSGADAATAHNLLGPLVTVFLTTRRIR